MATATCAPEERWRALLPRLTLALLLVGVAWRVLRYLLRLPIWGDEAMLCLNFLELDYAGLTRELYYCQVAPLLFLWGEATALRLLGGGELAMRLLPFLAGLGGLLLFWRLARLTLPPLAAMLGLGFLAVAIWPVSMCTFAKPYAFDLFMALVLLLPAAHCLRSPEKARWLLLLTLLTPFAIFGSYPAAFVGGAVSLALLPALWRPDRKSRLLYVAYNAALLGSFLAHFLIVGRGQLHTPVYDTTTELGMHLYWAEGFPPGGALGLVKWLLRAHTGQMLAYPVGAQDGGSALTALFCLVGAWHFWRTGRRPLLVLCLAPFALALFASVIRRYPYGASCRLSQHLAPAICLAAGAGAAFLIERLPAPWLRRNWAITAWALFFAVGLGGMARELVKPYRDRETKWIAEVMQAFAAEAEARPGAPIVVLNNPDEVDAQFRWHLALYGNRVSWNGKVDWKKATAGGEVLCVCYRQRSPTTADLRGAPTHGPAAVPATFATRLEESGLPWALRTAVTDVGVPASLHDPVKQLDQFRWSLPAQSGRRTPPPSPLPEAERGSQIVDEKKPEPSPHR